VKIIIFVLLILFFWLQYKIWLQDGGIPEVLQLQTEVETVKTEVDKLQERNASLDAEVKDLKKGLHAIEERARSEMGMIKKGEVYYQVIEPELDQPELDLPKIDQPAIDQPDENQPVDNQTAQEKQ
jgi:cell division protein FtsB